MKLEPDNIQLVLNSLSDTLELPDINLYITFEEVQLNADKIKIFKKVKVTHNSEELF